MFRSKKVKQLEKAVKHNNNFGFFNPHDYSEKQIMHALVEATKLGHLAWVEHILKNSSHVDIFNHKEMPKLLKATTTTIAIDSGCTDAIDLERILRSTNVPSISSNSSTNTTASNTARFFTEQPSRPIIELVRNKLVKIEKLEDKSRLLTYESGTRVYLPYGMKNSV